MILSTFDIIRKRKTFKQVSVQHQPDHEFLSERRNDRDYDGLLTRCFPMFQFCKQHKMQNKCGQMSYPRIIRQHILILQFNVQF